jgi:hypothetical protein
MWSVPILELQLKASSQRGQEPLEMEDEEATKRRSEDCDWEHYFMF